MEAGGIRRGEAQEAHLAIASSSPLAIGIGVPCGLLALSKLCLIACEPLLACGTPRQRTRDLASRNSRILAYRVADSIKFRKAPVFVNAQVPFTVVTIMGGVLADFTPLTMLGPTTTFRCHLFPTWLLVATTLLYGPLVLKTYRVWKILDNPSLRNVKVPTLKLLGMLGALVVFELLLALAWAPVD